jgi:hypothetical protein
MCARTNENDSLTFDLISKSILGHMVLCVDL